MKQLSPSRSWLIAIAVLLSCSFVSAQGTWSYAGPTDGAGGNALAETGKGICTDASGNVYMAGVFNSNGAATDFDLNGGTSTFTSVGNDGFIASYDKDGNFRWKTIISGSGNDFQIYFTGTATNSTHVWVAGSTNLSGAPQIISSTNTVTITSGTGLPASVDAMVAKLNCSNGAVQWVTTFGGSGGNDFATGITIDPNGSCYTLGAYSGAFTIGSVSAPALVGGSSDEYVAKLTPGGTLRYIRCGGSAGADMQGNGGGICYVPGASPTLVAVGSFNFSSATFGSQTVTNSGSANNNDMLLLELDTTLGVSSAIGMGTGTINLGEELYGAVYDPFSGGVFVTGYINGGTVSVPGVGNLTSSGGEDIFIGRYSVAANNFTWASLAGGSSANDRGYGITADGQGGIIMCGHTASSTCMFGSINVAGEGNGANDIVVARYNTSGTPIWALAAGGAAGDDGRSIASYVQTTPYQQYLYVTGNFQNTVTFGSTTLTADGTNNNDFYLARVSDATLPLSATQSQVNLTCNGVCTGSATVVASGGSPPYTYSWSPSGGSGATASSLCATNYTCTITDASSTSITRTFSITQPPAITITTISQTNVSCNGGTNGAAQVSASGGTGTLTYNWTPGNPAGDGTGSVTGLMAQVYTVTVTDQNSCTATRTFNITQPPALIITPVSQTNVACFGASTGAASVSVSGGTPGYSYNWTPGNPPGDGTASVTGLSAQAYTVTVTDANSCQGTRTFNITQPASAVSGSTVVTNVSCFGGNTGAIDLTPSGGTGGYTYQWLPSGPTTQDRTGLVAGTYSVQITDANGCTATVTATVTQPASPVSGTTVVTNIACFGGNTGAINLTPTGGSSPYTFFWLPSGPTTEDRTGLVAGTYTVQITDANGCLGTVTATVTQPAAPVSGTTVVTNVACFGGNTGAINLTPTGGSSPYTFNWLPSGPTTEDRTGLSAGTFTVEITDANGCLGTVTATVTEPASPVSGTTVVTDVTCSGGSDGAINLTPGGGTSPYTFNWLPSGPTTEDRTGLSAGTFTVEITDANGCLGTVTATVTEPASPVSGTTVVTNVACFGGNTGAINLTPTGGSSPYTFNWLPSGPTTEDRTGLSAGTFTVEITDANGCLGTVTATVTEPASPVSGTTVVTNVTCFAGSDGAINLTPTGGSSPYTFNWLPSGPTTEDRTGLSAGTFTVEITDANGCLGTVTATVTQPTQVVLTVASQSDVLCNGGSDGAASVNPASGGVGPYTYDWTPGAPSGDGTVSVTGLSAQTYTCAATDANGCVTSVTVMITEPSAISAPASSTPESCAGNDGTASVIASGGTGPYTYSWAPSGGTAATATGLTAGTYTCTITDANGCVTTSTIAVTGSGAGPSVSIGTTSPVSCFGGNDGSSSVNVTGGATPYTFAWTPSGGTAATATGLIAGTYTCTVTDDNGCTGTATVIITEPLALSASVAPVSAMCVGDSRNLVSTVNGGTTPYFYNWMPGAMTTANVTVSPSTTTVYTVTVNDANGCNTSATTTVTVNTPPSLNIVSNPANGIVCAGNQATLTANGAQSYSWTGGITNGVPFTPSATTTYTVTGTDVNGCTATAQSTITVQSCQQSALPCGLVVANKGTSASAANVPGATQYRFTFYDNVTLQQVCQHTQASRTLTFTSVPVYYNTTYRWTVAVNTGSGFGPESSMGCTITFGIPQTTVTCGNTVNGFNTYTTAQQRLGLTNYIFRFYDNVTMTLVTSRTQPSNYIYFNQVPGLQYGTTYRWTVQCEYPLVGGGTAVGPESSMNCTISFAGLRTTVPCNKTYNLFLNPYTTAAPVSGASGYRFTFYQGPTMVAQRAQPSNYIYFNQVTPTLAAGTYTWTVEVLYNSGAGPAYGPPSAPCPITFVGAVMAPQLNTQHMRTDAPDSGQPFAFAMLMYPNPLSDGQSPTIQITGADQKDAMVTVTDLTGRVITTYLLYCEGEVFTAQLTDFPELAAGMYVMQVTVGEQVQSQRFVAE